MVVALGFMAMTEAASLLESFICVSGSNITLKCLPDKSDEWDNLAWDRIRETGIESIGNATVGGEGAKEYKNEGNTEHVKLHRTSDIFTLSITNVQPSDSGAYCCMSKKSTGNAIRHVALLVVTDSSSTSSTLGTTATNVSQNVNKSEDCGHVNMEPCPYQSLLLQAMGGSLGLCVALIGFLVYLSYKRRVCQHCREKTNQVMEQQNTNLFNQNNCQDEEALNYAPIHFAKRGEQKKKKQKTTTQSQEETLYAGVKCS